MAQQNQQFPASWAAFTRGTATSPSGSRPSIHFDEESQPPRRPTESVFFHPDEEEDDDRRQSLRRRRSSIADRVHALRNAGGVNSFDNFARSWQRAAGFVEVVPQKQSLLYPDDENENENEEEEEYQRSGVTPSPETQRSLLAEQLASERSKAPEEAVEDAPPRMMSISPMASEQSPLLRGRGSLRPRGESIFNIEPQLASPFGGSYGSTWSSLASRVNESSMRHAGRLFQEQQRKGITEPDKEREPLLVKQIQEDDGKVVNVVVGQSTLPQTIFNSVNVLVGVGILALPLAIRYAGWVFGITFLCFSAITTSYTAKLLAKCLDVDNTLITFADLAYVAWGPRARFVTSILFSVELIGACVALVVLFADSLDALIPGYGVTEWKIVCGIVLIPLGFVPLRLLSFTSILGILCCLGIVMAVLVDGLIKPHQPGSLREPAQTYLFPANWVTLPISFGLLIAPWGGHSVFPNIYRDMRHPFRYHTAVNTTYIFSFLLDLLMAVIGVLMFGDGVSDEITKNIFKTKGYPQWIGLLVVVAIAIIPITKVPLNARPIVSTLEISLGLDARVMADNASMTGMSGLTRGLLKVAIRVLCTVLFVILAILIPDFDRIMSLLGAVACFAICIVLPCSFHLKLFGKELPLWQKVLDWTLVIVTSILALVSTAFNLIPKEKLGL